MLHVNEKQCDQEGKKKIKALWNILTILTYKN